MVLHLIGHGLLAAGGIGALLAGSLLLLWAGIPYSGVLLGVLAVIAVLMGGVLFGVVGSLRTLVRRPALTGKEGMIGEVGTVRSPVGADSDGVGVRSRGTVARRASVRSSGDRSARRRTHRGDGPQGEALGLRRGRSNAGGAHRTAR